LVKCRYCSLLYYNHKNKRNLHSFTCYQTFIKHVQI